MRRWILLALAASVACFTPAVAGSQIAEVQELPLPELLWNRIDHLLAERIHDGLVDYRGLNQDGRFRDAWDCLTSVDLEELESWPHDEQLAFWINAYNLATLKLIADHYPIRGRFPLSLIFPDNSILMIPGRWKGNRFPIAGTERTLDEIEHEILRKRFDEPRIHFAIVCASLGCPVLRDEAFRGARLEAQLEEQARTYFSRPTGLRVESRGRRPEIKLTKILEWFGADFAALDPDPAVLEVQSGKHRRLLAVVARWFPAEALALVRTRSVRVSWIGYDWELNEWKP
jgi:hypothetical protein